MSDRYWQWLETDGRFFLSKSDGANPVAEVEPLEDEEEMRRDLDLIVEAVNAWLDRPK